MNPLRMLSSMIFTWRKFYATFLKHFVMRRYRKYFIQCLYISETQTRRTKSKGEKVIYAVGLDYACKCL